MPNATDTNRPHRPCGSESIVYIVDDDPNVGDALSKVLEIEGFRTRRFQTGRAFLDSCSASMQGCLLLDLCMPDCSGLDLQKALAERNVQLPVIFLTGFGTLPTSSEAFRGGALDFLEKPVDRELLLDRVTEALKVDARRGAHDLQKSTVAERYAQLSARERQVLNYVVNGLSTKEMAKELGLSHRTVDTHRAHMMRKMGCSTLLQLMRAITPLLDGGGLCG